MEFGKLIKISTCIALFLVTAACSGKEAGSEGSKGKQGGEVKTSPKIWTNQAPRKLEENVPFGANEIDATVEQSQNRKKI